MANLKVTIVVRTKGPEGKRGWVRASGKNDPAGPLYLRYYNGSTPKHVKAGRFHDEAEVAKFRLERKLKAASMELEVPRPPTLLALPATPERTPSANQCGMCGRSVPQHLHSSP